MNVEETFTASPEGLPCCCCGKPIETNSYFTVSGRVVCSIHCASLLKATPEDACYICGQTVWEDVYYGTSTKLFCSEDCKDEYLTENEGNYRVSLPRYRPTNEDIEEQQYRQNPKKKKRGKRCVCEKHQIYVNDDEDEEYEENIKPVNDYRSKKEININKVPGGPRRSIKCQCEVCGKNIYGGELLIISKDGHFCSTECKEMAEA